MRKKIILIVLVILSFQSFGARILSVKKYQEVQKEMKSDLQEEKKNFEINKKTNKEKNIRKKIIEIALSKLNTPYLWGASGNNKFDCSSFIQYVYKQSINLSLPRISYEQANFGEKISYKNLKPGDIIAFDTLNKNRITHVGLYIGRNQFIHASSGYKKVVISELSGFYAEKFRYGVKIL